MELVHDPRSRMHQCDRLGRVIVLDIRSQFCARVFLSLHIKRTRVTKRRRTDANGTTAYNDDLVCAFHTSLVPLQKSDAVCFALDVECTWRRSVRARRDNEILVRDRLAAVELYTVGVYGRYASLYDLCRARGQVFEHGRVWNERAVLEAMHDRVARKRVQVMEVRVWLDEDRMVRRVHPGCDKFDGFGTCENRVTRCIKVRGWILYLPA